MARLPSAQTAEKGNRSIGFGVFNLLAGKALRAPLWLLLSAMLARALGPEGLGLWSMILAAGMLLNQLFLHWTQSITQRFARVDWVELKTLKPVFFTRAPLLIGGWLLAAIAIFLNPADWLGRGFGLAGMEVPVLLALFAFWCMAETQSLQQVRERFVALAWAPIVADSTLFLVVFTLVVIPMPLQEGLAGRLGVLLFSMAIGWLFWLAWELRSLGWQKHIEADAFKKLPTYMVFAAPLIPGFLVAYLAEWCDYFLIRYFYDESFVGLYHPAYQYLLILIGLPTALVSVLLPRAVQSFEANGKASLAVLLNVEGPRWAMVWLALMLVPLALLPEIFILLVGEPFEASKAVLSVLLAVIPGAITQHIFGIAYFVQGRLLISTFVFFCIKLVVNVSVSLLLLPRFGVLGASVGCVASYFVLQWLFLLFAQPGRGPSKVFVSFLCLAQLVGLGLCFIDGLWCRILFSVIVLFMGFFSIRFTSLFDVSTVKRLIPIRFKRYERWFLYWLVKQQSR